LEEQLFLKETSSCKRNDAVLKKKKHQNDTVVVHVQLISIRPHSLTWPKKKKQPFPSLASPPPSSAVTTLFHAEMMSETIAK
jgi:hypothetical protein